MCKTEIRLSIIRKGYEYKKLMIKVDKMEGHEVNENKENTHVN
jgi:hypothetical protein